MSNSSETPRALWSPLAHTAVIIPALNEEDSIGLVLDDLPPVACVVVANNGSTDRTADIATRAGCIVVDEPTAGYGRACLAGVSKVDQLVKQGLDIRYVAFVDGDYSDHPQELVEMLRVLCDDQCDFVLGSRIHARRDPGAMPPQAVWGNWLACHLMRILWKTNYTDLGPFRVIGYEQLLRLNMQDLNFGWTIEMQIKAKRAGLKTIEIPVPYRRRIGVSKISGTVLGTIRAGYKILFTIAKYGWQSKFNSKAKSLKPSQELSPVTAHKPA
ncbi:MAG: glycosyltransferase family 2 protein [Rubripirellula sp.]